MSETESVCLSFPNDYHKTQPSDSINQLFSVKVAGCVLCEELNEINCSLLHESCHGSDGYWPALNSGEPASYSTLPTWNL